MMRDTVLKIRKTGKAPEHKSKPIVPLHNILKPGAHPAHDKKGKEKASEHKETPKNATAAAPAKKVSETKKPIKIN